MKITKPETTISKFKFSKPDDAGTVAFFDPGTEKAMAGVVAVKKADADLIQASEDLRDNLIAAFHCIDNEVEINSTNFKEIDALKAGMKSALKKAGCKIQKS